VSLTNCILATTSLPSTFYWALDKDFAECHSVLGKQKPPSRRLVTKTVPLPSVLGDTRQRDYLSECSPAQHSATSPPTGPFVSFFTECSGRHSAKLASLPSVRTTTLGKEALLVPRCSFFAECYGSDTRQRTSLGKVTNIHLFNLFLLFHPNKQNISHNIIYIT
jgi:hypothetical protein